MRHRVKSFVSGSARARRRAAHAVVLGVGLGAWGLVLDEPVFARDADKSAAQNGQTVPVLFSADEVNYDDEYGLVIARGNVEISQGNRTLLADMVSYNQRTDTVTASGHVSMLQETGDIVFGNYVELTDSMREGFIQDVRILMADRSRVAGNTARRTDANRTEIRRGVYSPCDLCKDDPTQPPLWQLKAAKIVHDKELQRVEYEDVTLEMGGYPVLYSPYFSHPDPSVKRASGFLPPTLGSSNTLGFNFTTPYYWVLAPDKDLTISPLFTLNQGIDLGGEYRQRFSNGFIDTRASITQADLVGGANNNTTVHDQIRGHIASFGEFDLDENWRTGWAIRRTTDQTYERLYHFGGNENFLTSDAYVENFDGRNYGSVNAYSFQSLRLGVSDRAQPYVLPLGDYSWDFRPTVWGGHFTVNANGADIIRETGPSSRRASVGGEFNLPWITRDGSAFNFVAGVRADGYNVGSQPVVGTGLISYINGQPSVSHPQIFNGSTGRVFPQIGLEWRDPFVRQSDHSTLVITPRAAIYAAPIGGNPPQIPNDDSVSFDYNENDLFVRNRLVGYDQVDSGQRVDYGVQADWTGDDGSKARALVGASYRFQRQTPLNYGLGLNPVTNGAYQPTVAINSGTGINRQNSDYVGRLSYSPSGFIDASYRFRFDREDLRPEHQELGVNFGPSWLRMSTSYLQLGDNPRDGESRRQELSVNLNYVYDQYWTFSARATRELSGDNVNQVSSGFAAQYQDECLTVIASLTQTGVRDRDIKPGTTLLFQFVFKNLGEIALPQLQAGNESLP
ncbi:LPS-assembly protein LptD [Aliidongia dinghuensis]|uniref:LPS-assembly protein LptD n=1 Tax=Aliidongia dinghuensis TaxID=1867774 RepID=A0A8J2YVE1_9PROT|nr:LPS assembly protein LptD [Aliidongia dinghuensis]GGF25245.1 LPS-assembly protein LptD [Aliidongia dinghuensis]